MIRHQEWAGAYRIVPEELEPKQGPRVLFVGEDNPQTSDPRHALWPVPANGKTGCAGKNLQGRILGLPHGVYYSLWRTNACAIKWSFEDATRRVRYLVEGDHPWRTIVLLGRKVTTCAESVIKKALPAFEKHYHWCEVERAGETVDRYPTLISLPHPSGLTRDWNDEANIDRAREILMSVETEVPWGSLGKVPVDGDA